MAKKKYRISKPNLMGGSVSSDSKQIQNMALGGNAIGNNEQIQAIMKTIYDLFKQGMTKMDIENSLLGQGMPYEFITQSINVVEKYMVGTGEYDPEEEEPSPLSNGLPSENAKQPSQLSQQQDAQMEAYKQQSMDAAMSDEGEEESDELLYRENPYMQMGGFNPMQQQENPQQKTEQKDFSSVPYYPNIEFFGGGQEKVFMKEGGKVSKKQFMKNVLKRFEEGGPKETPLTSAPKKDTLEKDVEKVTKGFVSAVQGKAKESVAKEMHKLVEESGDPKLQQILMSGNQQQQPMQPMAREGMMVNGDDEPIAGQYPMTEAEAEANAFYPTTTGEYPNPLDRLSRSTPSLAERIAKANSLTQNTMTEAERAAKIYEGYDNRNIQEYDRDINAENKYTAAKNAQRAALEKMYLNALRAKPEERRIQDSMYPKQELGGMQYADDGIIVDPGGQTYQEYIDWYNTEDPKNPFNPATESKAPPMSEEEFNTAYGESAETDIYGRTVYRDKYVPSSQNYGYGYGIRDILFPANRFMGYRPKYHVDPRLGKPVAIDVYGKTLFGGNKSMYYYEMPDEDFDPEILRRKDINKRARQGNKFLRKALKGKLDYKDILNRTSTRGRNLDDAGNDMGVDPKKPSRRETDKQGLFASDPTWNEENWEEYGKKGQRKALQDYRFDKEDYNMRHKLSPNYEIYNTKERPRIEGFKNKVKGAIQKINPFKEIGGESLNKFLLGGFDPTEPYKDPYAYNVEMDNPSDEMINSDIESFKGAQNAIDGSDDEKRKLFGIKNKDKLGIRDGKPFNAIANWLGERGVGIANKYIADKQEASYMAQDKNMKEEGQSFKDKGDYDIYGNFRPNEEGFIGSANNPGMTGSRVGFTQKGGIAEGEVREMTLAEIQAFMDAGGKLEFL
jgi:hypothetical protein